MIRQLYKKAAEYRGVYDARAYVDKYDHPKDKTGERVWFLADPDEIYPATIGRILMALKETAHPDELIDPKSVAPLGVAVAYVAEARNIPGSAWNLAMWPKEKVNPTDHPARAAALDLARRWFTQALHVKVGGVSMGLHISNNPDYRL